MLGTFQKICAMENIVGMTIFVVAEEKICYLEVCRFAFLLLCLLQLLGAAQILQPLLTQHGQLERRHRALPDVDEAWIFSESNWRGQQMKINTYRSVSLSFLTDPELMSSGQKPCYEGLVWQHCSESKRWVHSSYPLVTALVSAGISLGKYLALPGSSGRMGV